MDFTPIRRVRLVEQVAGAIRDAILGGTYTAGDPLPSERSMAEQFGVNRSSVREALQRLEAQGLVEMRQGGATMVCDVLASAGLSLLPHLLAPGGALDERLLADLLDIRVMLIGWTAHRAASMPTEAAVTRLRELLAELEKARDPRAAQAADWAFFEHLVAMTDNRVLSLLAAAVGRVYRVHGRLFEGLYRDFDPGHHRAAVEAIAEGRSEQAAVAMRGFASTAMCTLAAETPAPAPEGASIAGENA